MKIGFIRFSKQEQNEALQVNALRAAGCEKWFADNQPSRLCLPFLLL
jgi:DNA invertase Pin-like site-specific DNA recombinase